MKMKKTTTVVLSVFLVVAVACFAIPALAGPPQGIPERAQSRVPEKAVDKVEAAMERSADARLKGQATMEKLIGEDKPIQNVTRIRGAVTRAPQEVLRQNMDRAGSSQARLAIQRAADIVEP